MGFFDKIKSAVNAVTGGAAKVTIEFQPTTGYAGDQVLVKISVVATGNSEVKSKGMFVDLRSVEEVTIKKNVAGTDNDIGVSHTTFEQEFKIAPDFVLAGNETKLFEGTIQLPANVQPTYEGHFTQHRWEIRGRMEAFGNDPDSGYLPFRVGMKM